MDGCTTEKKKKDKRTHAQQHLKLPPKMEEIIVLTSHKSKFTLS